MPESNYKYLALRAYALATWAEELKPGIERADALSAAVTAKLAHLYGNRAYPEFSRGEPLMERIKTFAALII